MAYPEHEEETVTELDDAVRAVVSSMLSSSCSEQVYLGEVSALCRAKSHAAYRLLSQIERYRRLGRMPMSQYRAVRARIEEALQAREAPWGHGTAATGATAPQRPEPVIGEEGPEDAVTRDLLEQPLPSLPLQRVSAAVASAPPAVHQRSPSEAPASAVPAAAPTALSMPPPTSAPAVAAAPAPRATNEDAGPGTLIRGRYELLSLLGRGGMGSVYKARDRYRASLGLEDCYVAVKIARPRVPETTHGQALGREFHNAQKLSHPNVINVYEIDQEGPINYYTMELLEGERLSQLLKHATTPLPRRYALAIVREVGAAIVHAHSRGVVHGDLKPHNVMITQHGEVRVLDFGGLSVEPQGPWISEQSTGGNFRPATPAYASCEQLEGRRADPRDDLYALACMTYQLLSGRHPFERANALEARARRLRPRRPVGLRAESWRALRRGLAFQREQRAMPMQLWLKQLSVASAAERLPPPAQLWSSPRRANLWPQRVAAALLACLVLALALYTLQGIAAPAWHHALSAARTTLHDAWQEIDTPASAAESASSSEAAPASPARVPVTAPLAAAAPSPPASDSAAGASPDATAAATAPKVPAAASRSNDPRAPVNPVAPPVTFAATAYTVPDNDPAARIIVRRLSGTRGEVSFVWWTEEASAKPDVDYAPLGRRTEHIPNGAEQVTVYVPIISNPLRHQPTQFRVALGATDTADPTLAHERATVTIQRGG